MCSTTEILTHLHTRGLLVEGKLSDITITLLHHCKSVTLISVMHLKN